MFRKNLIIAVALGALLIPSLAGAGAQWNQPARVVKSASGGGYFYGAFGSVRNSSNVNEYIRCYSNSYGSAGCNARDAEGDTLYCTATSESVKVVIRDLNDSSYLFVRVSPSGICDYAYTQNNSAYAPK